MPPAAGQATNPDDHLVVFTPSGRRGRTRSGTTVLDAARSLGVDIDAVCASRGICGRCQITQGLGTFTKHGITSAEGNLAPEGSLEATYRAESGMASDRRLSCTAEVRGDVLIDVPPESQVHRQVVRKGLDVRDFTVDPVVRLHYVEVTHAGAGVAHRRPRPALRRTRTRVGPDRPRSRPVGHSNAPAGPRSRQVRGHRGGPSRPAGDRRLARTA